MEKKQDYGSKLSQKERAKAKYEQMKLLGLCHQCGDKSDGKVACQPCRQRTIDRLKSLYELRKASGLCARCGKPKEREGTYCEPCNKAKSARDKPRRPKEYQRRKANGICSCCAKPHDGSGVTCKSCRIKRRPANSRYVLRRYKDDIQFRIAHNLRACLSSAIRHGRSEGRKAGSSVRDLGCSVDELIQHLESQFTIGMNWTNYGNRKGQWSIDHKFPLSLADLSDRSELLRVCHYTNLQPMWHADNARKGNSITEKEYANGV